MNNNELFKQLTELNLSMFESWLGNDAVQNSLKLWHEEFWQNVANYYQSLPVDEHTAKQFDFYNNVLKAGFAPKNCPFLNKEVIEECLRTQGQNLLEGTRNFIEDLQKGSITVSDQTHFEVGKNLATTEGSVLLQNDIMQLIYYTPKTAKVYQNPILIVPPWINKYYILDLQPHNSLVKWLVDKGHQVFIISWNNPDASMADTTFEDYMISGTLAAVECARNFTKAPINITGYCIGGTLTVALMAYLAGIASEAIESCTLLTSLVDFADPGALEAFIDEHSINNIETLMQATGYFDGAWMKGVFSLLKPQQMIWDPFINNYLLGKSPRPFNILHWNDDSTRLPYKMHSYYLRNMYLENNLAKPGALKLGGVALDVSKITTPLYCVASEYDHIVPWQAAYKSAELLASKNKTFVLCGSGHVASIVNPPSENKYYFYTKAMTGDAKQWFESIEKQCKGSWWPTWQSWLKQFSGPLIKKPQKPKKIIESAPGSYVKKT